MSATGSNVTLIQEGKTQFGLPIDFSFANPASEDRIQTAAASLRKHDFEVVIVDSPADARRYVNSILPTDKRIFTAASETLRLSGIDEDVNSSGKYNSVRQELAKLDRKTQMPDMRRLAATPDVVLGSVHAVTEYGRLVVASASGSQLGPYSSGAGKVIFVVGSQKLVPDLDTAMKRLQFYAYPMEDIRTREKYGMTSTLAKILILNSDWPAGRSTVVLIREPIGF
jgi:acyl-CoA hydrolase